MSAGEGWWKIQIFCEKFDDPHRKVKKIVAHPSGPSISNTARGFTYLVSASLSTINVLENVQFHLLSLVWLPLLLLFTLLLQSCFLVNLNRCFGNIQVMETWSSIVRERLWYFVTLCNKTIFSKPCLVHVCLLVSWLIQKCKTYFMAHHICWMFLIPPAQPCRYLVTSPLSICRSLLFVNTNVIYVNI